MSSIPPWIIRKQCRFCSGKGCLNCDTLVAEEYRRQFPDGPKPLLTVERNNEGELALLKSILHRRELEQACGPDGGGMVEIHQNLDYAQRKEGEGHA